MSEGVAAAAEAAHGEEGSGFIMEHVLNSDTLHLPFIGHVHLPHLKVFGVDMSITKHVVMLWAAALIVFLLLLTLRRHRKGDLVPTGLANALEAMVSFVRDEIAIPNIGAHDARRFLPFLLTAFFFILSCNLLGMVPYAATATGNVNTTAGLAICAFVAIQIGGIVHNGFFGYFKGLVPHGLPWPLLPIMIPIEFIGLFTKPFALCIRLFANMTAGHIVILSLLGLIFILKTLLVAPVSVAFAVGVSLLELFVALIQAYIFTMLSAVFIGMAVHQEH
ncbi:MAG: ATP synthase F0 subunit A [Candidatus Handelsmanbacteria bacterium RIFCSPLOWO2_12_FULL_64_10]|uniref:ATP synthase subunit a n=1 Tax=Handelsmanbacteria sp. (strain RIFCSPLOWO2_12_FULL_64_10) TaxID=1817868 RepID=A0A1F6C5D5_HANXR|nr:MAG: ATP synthase F0 subunit A [Candidatus Handelsmanbacteria bacterium RIFCSPLOWO2_12_FULL_64_10]